MDIVTSVDIGQKRVKMVVNDTESFTLTPRQFYQLGLREGDEVNLSELEDSILTVQYPKALDAAVRQLALRQRSRGELEDMLKKRLYTEKTIEMVLYKLEKEGFLNDAEFASEWARARTRRQVGMARIKSELRQKGVSGDVIDEALSDMPAEDIASAALALAEKLLSRHRSEEPRKAMEKSIAAMLRRGYSYQEAADALRAAIKQDT